jgi:hypothetical protein
VTAYSEETARSGGGVNLRGINIGGRSTNIGVGGKRTQAYIAVDHARRRCNHRRTGPCPHRGRPHVRYRGEPACPARLGRRQPSPRGKDTPAGEAIRAALIEITDYLECSMVLKTSSCLATYQEREDTRRERTRSRLRF